MGAVSAGAEARLERVKLGVVGEKVEAAEVHSIFQKFGGKRWKEDQAVFGVGKKDKKISSLRIGDSFFLMQKGIQFECRGNRLLKNCRQGAGDAGREEEDGISRQLEE